MSNQSRIETAYREAGHALIIVLSGQPLKWVTIRPSGKRLGYCRSDWSGMFPYIFDEHLTTLLRIFYAGAIAEMIGTQDGWSPSLGWRPSNEQGAGKDMSSVEMLLQRIARHRGEEFVSHIDHDAIIAETYALLIRPPHRRALDVLAHILLERTALKRTTAEMIVLDTMTFPPRDGCIYMPGPSLEAWKGLVELAASYDERRGGWWVAQSAVRRASDILDRALLFKALRDAGIR